MPEFRAMNGVRFDRRRINVDGKTRQRRICIMGQTPQVADPEAWIDEAVKDFNARLEDMTRGGA
jgi:hypothetical protein